MMLIARRFDEIATPCTVAILWTGTQWRCIRQLHDTLEVDQLTEGSLATAWLAFHTLQAALSMPPHPHQKGTP